MLNLAFDTSTSFGSVVLFEDQQILFEKSWFKEKSHSEMLNAALAEAFEASSKKPQDIERLYVGVGPGSFTGLRVAVNVAKSLGFALSLPLFCIDSFDILALGVDPSATDQNFLLGMIDAYNNELFFTRFEKINSEWQRLTKSQSKTIQDLGLEIKTPHLCLGDAYNHYEEHFSPKFKKFLVRDKRFSQFPDVKNLVQKSGALEKIVQVLNWNEAQALYIKASAAEEKLNEIKTR